SDTLDTPLQIYLQGLYVQGNAHQATFWSPDGQRIVVTTQSQSGQHASLLTRAGALIDTVPLPSTSIFGVMNEDQLVVQGGAGIQWLPWRAGAAPYAPDVAEGSTAIYMPPLGRSAAKRR